MKLVESKEKEITIDEVVDRFDELIVAAYDGIDNRLYNLTKMISGVSTYFIGNDFKNEMSYGTYSNLEEGLYEWSISNRLNVQVFETYKEFIDWMSKLSLDK